MKLKFGGTSCKLALAEVFSFHNGCNYENRALIPSTFRPKLKTANRDELAANTSRPIFIVGLGGSWFYSLNMLSILFIWG
jgi:hypothetical protein